MSPIDFWLSVYVIFYSTLSFFDGSRVRLPEKISAFGFFYHRFSKTRVSRLISALTTMSPSNCCAPLLLVVKIGCFSAATMVAEPPPYYSRSSNPPNVTALMCLPTLKTSSPASATTRQINSTNSCRKNRLPANKSPHPAHFCPEIRRGTSPNGYIWNEGECCIYRGGDDFGKLNDCQ